MTRPKFIRFHYSRAQLTLRLGGGDYIQKDVRRLIGIQFGQVFLGLMIAAPRVIQVQMSQPK